MSTADSDLRHDDLAGWRKELRASLLDLRMRATEQQRTAWSESIVRHLSGVLPPDHASVLGFCWPYRGEPDVRPAVKHWIAHGRKAAMPIVIGQRAPMIFRRWYPDAPMTRGAHDIPIPDGTEELQPDVLLVPLTGFDSAGYRLGYGGGFFDRTVVALTHRPLLIGVGFELSRLETIRPQAHDQPMDIIVTEAGLTEHNTKAAAL